MGDSNTNSILDFFHRIGRTLTGGQQVIGDTTPTTPTTPTGFATDPANFANIFKPMSPAERAQQNAFNLQLIKEAKAPNRDPAALWAEQQHNDMWKRMDAARGFDRPQQAAVGENVNAGAWSPQADAYYMRNVPNYQPGSAQWGPALPKVDFTAPGWNSSFIPNSGDVVNASGAAIGRTAASNYGGGSAIFGAPMTPTGTGARATPAITEQQHLWNRLMGQLSSR